LSGTLHGFAFSPDRTLLVAVTGEAPAERAADHTDDDDAVMGPDNKVWLDVRDGARCEPIRRMELAFPERPTRSAPLFAPKNKYWANARMMAQFADAVAVSPDNRWAAIGYGVRFDGMYGDSQAFVAIFSLRDGHRASVIAGHRVKHRIWPALAGGDLAPTSSAPLGEALIFGTDAKSLYGTSERLFRLDVSKLR
jgi:hypothetical protein